MTTLLATLLVFAGAVLCVRVSLWGNPDLPWLIGWLVGSCGAIGAGLMGRACYTARAPVWAIAGMFLGMGARLLCVLAVAWATKDAGSQRPAALLVCAVMLAVGMMVDAIAGFKSGWRQEETSRG